jgi:preprotein translocase subunit SecE
MAKNIGVTILTFVASIIVSLFILDLLTRWL